MKIGIIGYGNLGWHLAEQFKLLQKHDIHVFSRNVKQHPSTDFTGFRVIFNLDEFSKGFDFIFLAVIDDSIASLAKQLSKIVSNKTIIVHSSGAGKIDLLAPHLLKAVFWPLMSIRKESIIDWKNCPIFISSSDESTLIRLQELALTISDDVIIISDEDRLHYHLAAVWSNNFSNIVISIAHRQLLDKNLDPNKLSPILKQNLERMATSHPKELQTGPAIRKDLKTIAQHLSLMSDKDKSLYLRLSQEIAAEHGKELPGLQQLIN